jgi:hypothetical protein
MIAFSLQTIIVSVFTFALSLNAPPCVKAQPAASDPSRKAKASAISRQEEMRVQEGADRFVKRFRKTLDFGSVFDEMSVSNVVQRMREARFFEYINLGAKLVDSVDDPTLKRAYKALMNFYYLKTAYDLSIRPIAGNEQKGDPPLPQEIISALSSSRYLSVLLFEGAKDAPYATTKEELEQFVADFERVAALYKKHLSPNFFNSATYKTNVRAINKDEHVQIRVGDEGLGVEKGTKVYEVTKDIFTFFFLDENGQLKVLTLGLGN